LRAKRDRFQPKRIIASAIIVFDPTAADRLSGKNDQAAPARAADLNQL
jgi:hypothetical protein